MKRDFRCAKKKNPTESITAEKNYAKKIFAVACVGKKKKNVEKNMSEYINFSHSTLLMHPTGTLAIPTVMVLLDVHRCTYPHYIHASMAGEREPDDQRKEKIHLRAAIVQRCVHFRCRLMIGRPKT